MPKQQIDADQTNAAKVRQAPRNAIARRIYRQHLSQRISLKNRPSHLFVGLLLGLLMIMAVSLVGSILFRTSSNINVRLVSSQEILVFTLVNLGILVVIGIVVLFLVRFFFLRNEKSKPTRPFLVDEPDWDRSKLAYYASLQQRSSENYTIFSIRILEEPLTAQNVATLLSAFTEFYVKCWLIAQKRFADLMEYTQTHALQLSEEVGLVISKISYNSPLNIDMKVDMSIKGLVDGLVTAVDGVAQARQRQEKAELENRGKEQELQQQTVKADKEIQGMLLENEKAALEIEKQRLELLEKRLEVQKRGIEYALEIAGKTVDALHPSADAETRAMIIQALLPNILQFQNGQGLELALPAPQNGNNGVTDEK